MITPDVREHPSHDNDILDLGKSVRKQSDFDIFLIQGVPKKSPIKFFNFGFFLVFWTKGSKLSERVQKHPNQT